MEPSGGILIIRKELLSVSILNFESVSKKTNGRYFIFISHSKFNVPASTFVNATRKETMAKKLFFKFSIYSFLNR